MTLGFEVFVQLVMAATTTAPCSRPSTICGGASSTATDEEEPEAAGLPFFSAIIDGRSVWNPIFAFVSDTRSCGRFGPARLGSTRPRLSSIVSSYTASLPASRNSPCAFAYASTSFTCEAERPVSVR